MGEIEKELNDQLDPVLAEAINMFGPSYYVLDRPLRFHAARPACDILDNGRTCIYLNEYGLKNKWTGFAETAHEAVHSLLRAGKGQACIKLEEGMACYFEKHYCDNILGMTPINHTAPNYKEAYELYKELHEFDPTIIIRIRAGGKPLASEITFKDLIEANPKIRHDLAKDITQPFDYS